MSNWSCISQGLPAPSLGLSISFFYTSFRTYWGCFSFFIAASHLYSIVTHSWVQCSGVSRLDDFRWTNFPEHSTKFPMCITLQFCVTPSHLTHITPLLKLNQFSPQTAPSHSVVTAHYSRIHQYAPMYLCQNQSCEYLRKANPRPVCKECHWQVPSGLMLP